jgi:hypothetical protein
LKEEDRQLFESILSPGEEKGRLTLAKVMRNGSLLLALPMNQGLALATLGLYQPQRWKGRSMRMVMKTLVVLGLHRFLPTIEVKIGDAGLFSGLGGCASPEKFGFLLGNAESETRNLIGVYQDTDSLSVVKAGRGGSTAVIRTEYAAMQQFSDRVDEAPQCRQFFEIEDGAAYVVELVKGRSPRGTADDKLVFGILMRWLDAGAETNVSELDCWKSLEEKLDKKMMNSLHKLAGSQVVSPVMHGDFAPWNIKIGSGDRVKVLDWEYTEVSGMPGWDWLHYHVQRMNLVSGEPAEIIVSSCRVLMGSDPMSTYLNQAGMRGLEDELLGSYLLYSGEVLSYPREDLLEAWSLTREGTS